MVGDVEQVEIMMCGVDGQHLVVTEVIKGLDQSSAALARADPCVAGRTFDVVSDADFLLNIWFITFQIQSREQPRVEIKIAFCRHVCRPLGGFFPGLTGCACLWCDPRARGYSCAFRGCCFSGCNGLSCCAAFGSCCSVGSGSCRWAALGSCRWAALGFCRWAALGLCRWAALGSCRWAALGLCRCAALGLYRWAALGLYRWAALGLCRCTLGRSALAVLPGL